ncbi:hypothetical protein Pla52n_48950 [Stieleria varia]|uniref:Uncharacterized protein n=1 Tax=Stieleria varia TaxID=2528005 RepID=A0A5C6AEB1_9BACT|nr:hypothetical protein Pla52n_48950 [Stieleria varia]
MGRFQLDNQTAVLADVGRSTRLVIKSSVEVGTDPSARFPHGQVHWVPVAWSDSGSDRRSV